MKQIMIAAVLLGFLIKASTAQDAVKATALATGFETGANEISDYNTACYFALSGNKRLAFIYLRKVVHDGYDRPGTMLADSDFNSLHNEAEWASLVKLAKENEERSKTRKNLFFNQTAFWESKFFQTPYRENISEDEKVAGLSKLWSEAKYNFINFDLVPQVNIDSLYFAYLPKVRNTRSTLDYYNVLTEMYAQLNDAHTKVHGPAELRNELYARPLLRTRLIEDKVLVVQADKTLQEKGIKVGMEIVMVNGLPVKEYAAKFVKSFEAASTPQDKDVRSYEYALFSGSLKEPIQLKLADGKGHNYEKTIFRVSPEERSAKFNYPDVEYKMLPGNISYLAINTYVTDTGSKVFVAKYPEIAKSKAIILDLRNNGGGSTDWKILRFLIDTPMLVQRAYARQYVPTFRAWRSPQDTWDGRGSISPYKGKLYAKPVILLISARTFSAAEDFAAAFKSIKRGLIMGEATGGSSGQPLGFTLPGNLYAQVCTIRDQYANGDDFVGKGIQPDITVLPTIDDVRKGVDTQLEAALKELRKLE